MQILPWSDGADPHACQLLCEQFPVRLTLSGLSAEELSGLFDLEAGRSVWPPTGPMREIVIDNASAGVQCETSPRQTIRLDDGEVELTSGRPARLRPSPNRSEPPLHFPQSLYLCLAQQWARSGLFALHAAAIDAHPHGILVLGDRCAGKSTLALSALAAGFGVVSDDWLLFGLDTSAHHRVERLRGHLAIRPGLVSDHLDTQLRQTGIELPAKSARKRVIALSPGNPRFPTGGRVDRIWHLIGTAGERPAQTVIRPRTPAQTLASLVTAAMPLLLSDAFPIERERLMATAQSLLSTDSGAQVESGRDLVYRPETAWSTLLHASKQP